MLNVLKNTLRFLSYLFLLWLALAIAVMCHEWVHGFLAWIFGYKTSPFAIDYGGWSFSNVLIFSAIDQAVNDYAIAFIGHPFQSAIILIVPPIIINGGLSLLSFHLLRKSLCNEKACRAWVWFLYCSIIWNVGEFFSYTCLRSFSTHADIGLFLEYTSLSPWVIFIPGLYVSFYWFHLTLGRYKIALLQHLEINVVFQYLICLVSILLLTVLEALRSFGSHFNPIVNFVDVVTLMSVPWLWWRYGR